MLQNSSFTGITNWELRHGMLSQNEWNGHAATRCYWVQENPWPKTTGLVAKEMAKKGFEDNAEIHIS